MPKLIETEVRGLELRLTGGTRALELCARMNRELEVLDFIDGISPGEVMFDLGACEGRFALYAARRGVTVFAFEPERMNFEVLCSNRDLNAEAAVRLHPLNLAVGAQTRQTTLRIGQPWAGGHHRIVADVAGRCDLAFETTMEQPIEVVALDDLVASGELPVPDHLKVDVDGSELAFVTGAAGTLGHPKLRRVMFELNERDEGYAEVVRTMESHGFRCEERFLVEPSLYNCLFVR